MYKTTLHARQPPSKPSVFSKMSMKNTSDWKVIPKFNFFRQIREKFSFHILVHMVYKFTENIFWNLQAYTPKQMNTKYLDVPAVMVLTDRACYTEVSSVVTMANTSSCSTEQQLMCTNIMSNSVCFCAGAQWLLANPERYTSQLNYKHSTVKYGHSSTNIWTLLTHMNASNVNEQWPPKCQNSVWITDEMAQSKNCLQLPRVQPT